MSAAKYALGYIARGLAVVPVVHGEKKCIQRDGRTSASERMRY